MKLGSVNPALTQKAEKVDMLLLTLPHTESLSLAWDGPTFEQQECHQTLCHTPFSQWPLDPSIHYQTLTVQSVFLWGNGVEACAGLLVVN